MAAWFQGSGERWADDVRIMGSRLSKGSAQWSAPFLMADVPDFPDINPVLFVDRKNELWLVWYTVIANQWETSLLKYRKSRDYMESEGAPNWYWQDTILVKPGGLTERGIQPGDRFVESVARQLQALDGKYRELVDSASPEEAARMTEAWENRKERIMLRAAGQDMLRTGRLYNADGSYTEKPLGFPYFRRMGWQTLNKPFFAGQRMILPLYSDGFGFSLMAITEDFGSTWTFSEPLVEIGNIQPGIARKANGHLVAYMRDNGPPPKRLHVSESGDLGETWSLVTDSELPNPGSGADIVTLDNGHWVLMFNNTERGRHSLVACVSLDEGKSWSDPGIIEFDGREDNPARGHYPALIQGEDGSLHAVYSYHRQDESGKSRKTIRYVNFSEDWILEN